LREIIDRDLECAEMTAGVSDLSFRYRKIGVPRRHDRRRRFNQDGDIEMFLEQLASFDSSLITAADENDAATLQFDDRHSRRGLGRRRQQRRHFWTRVGGFTGPSGGLADIDEFDRPCPPNFRRHPGEQMSFLRASNGEWRVARRDGAEPIELGAA
jgi:hypothetical protein